MTTTQESNAGAGEPGALTDGIHLLIDALKLNDVQTIYGVVGIPITDVARLAQRSGDQNAAGAVRPEGRG
mgnify:CR=1 FL=1